MLVTKKVKLKNTKLIQKTFKVWYEHYRYTYNRDSINRIYKCKNCDFILDRDLNGSRNILIKNTDFN